MFEDLNDTSGVKRYKLSKRRSVEWDKMRKRDDFLSFEENVIVIVH